MKMLKTIVDRPGLAMMLWLFGLLSPCAEAAVFRVGSDPACTHTDIQSAIDAAAANGGATLDSILIARNRSYVAQALVIDSQRLLLRGGYADCSSTTRDLPLTVLDGAGNGNNPVLEIRSPGSTRQLVQITALELRGGNATTGDGGALRIVGNAQLDLFGVYLHDNSAISGGAIHARGNSLTEILDLTLGTDGATGEPFRAEGNAANLGGAVYIGAYARLSAGGARIAENHAIFGGGVYFGPDGDGYFSFGPGVAAPATYGIHSNTAEKDGGGIYIASGRMHNVFRYSAVGSYRISSNEAGRDGGGIFVSGAGSLLLAYGLQLDGNRAGTLESGRGGGGYAGNGGAILIRGDSGGDPVSYCPSDAPCASASGNRAGLNGHFGQGGGLFADLDGHVTFVVGELRGNESDRGSAGMAAGNNARLTLDSVLVIGNNGDGGTLLASSAATLDLQGITLADAAGSGPLLGVEDAALNVFDSIIHQPGRVAATIAGASTISTECVFSHENFHPGGDVRVFDPGFIDAAHGDYRLQLDSPALDACSDPKGYNRDVRDNPRGVDLPEIPDIGGPFDAGAFEAQTGDRLFADGFDTPAP